MNEAVEYWRSGEGLAHISPPGNPDPETPVFRELIENLFYVQDTVDVGCGVGRLAPWFDPQRYHGVDISPKAIAIAKERNPGYQFDVIDDAAPIEGGFACWLHTVLLHVPDDLLSGQIARLTQRHVVVSEILGRNWRRAGNPPVYNREVFDYGEAFKPHGYKLARVMYASYGRHYGADTKIAVLQFHKERSVK